MRRATRGPRSTRLAAYWLRAGPRISQRASEGSSGCTRLSTVCRDKGLGELVIDDGSYAAQALSDARIMRAVPPLGAIRV
jgi:hypothetical protein